MDEQTFAEQEVPIPPYYERFQEERDKRFSSEIARLTTEIRHNGQRIDDLKADNAIQHEELRAAVAGLDSRIEGLRTELKTDIAEVRAELKTDIAEVRAELKADIRGLDERIEKLRGQLDSQFRWTVGLLLPVILGVVAILIQNILK